MKSTTGINVGDNLLNFVTHHGLPKKITTNSGTEFKNYDLKDFVNYIILNFIIPLLKIVIQIDLKKVFIQA